MEFQSIFQENRIMEPRNNADFSFNPDNCNAIKGEREGNPLAKQKVGIKENLTIFFFKLHFYA